MFNIGTGELVMAGVLALLLIKPEKLPAVAIALGRFFAGIQNTLSDVKKGFEKEIKDPLKKSIDLSSINIEDKEDKTP